MIEYNHKLTEHEKVLLMRETFNHKSAENTITNVGDYLAQSFNKIDGFNYKWNSLITSNPLLFEDIDYLRVKSYIQNTITQEEIDAYKRGDIKELYHTFENMLICNLSMYDRIMTFCTMIFLHYVRINDELINVGLDKIPYFFDITPTKLYCAVMTNVNSSEFELNYAWSYNKPIVFQHLDNDKTLLENNWRLLYSNPIFAKFIEYSALRTGINGFRANYYSDKTSNRKLAQVCSKFTQTSTALSEEQLDSLYDYIDEQEKTNKKLYQALHESMSLMFNGDTSQYAIYVFSKEFYIHSSKFSMRVTKNNDGKITKDYLANSYECFAAEEYLYKSIKAQIEWAKYILPNHYEYDKQILKTMVKQMLIEDYKSIICVKRMNDYGITSRIKFSGIFGNIYIIEDLLINNRIIRTSKICLSKENASKYIVDRGYYIVGVEADLQNLITINKTTIVNHYLKYCIPVLNHMVGIISMHQFSKNEIIDIVVSGFINPMKINNSEIKYTNLKTEVNSKELMSIMHRKLESFDNANKSYWKVIDD